MADIDRTDAEGLLQDQNVNEILKDAVKSSAAMQSFRTLRMGTKIAKMPILTAIPTAQWVSGDTGRKPTSEAVWEKKTITAEELAVIVPVSENVFDDSEFNIWSEVRPLIAQALGKALDEAVFFGLNAPASFDPSLYEGAVTASQGVEHGDGVDIADEINEAWGIVEDLGWDVNVQYAHRGMKRRLRGLRDSQNNPVYLSTLRSDGRSDELMGQDIFYVANGAWDRGAADIIVGDRTKAILGIREDVSYKISDTATLTDGSGNVTFSLYEQDMVAIRAKFRAGFVVADVLSFETGDQAWPFAYVEGDESS